MRIVHWNEPTLPPSTTTTTGGMTNIKRGKLTTICLASLSDVIIAVTTLVYGSNFTVKCHSPSLDTIAISGTKKALKKLSEASQSSSAKHNKVTVQRVNSK